MRPCIAAHRCPQSAPAHCRLHCTASSSLFRCLAVKCSSALLGMPACHSLQPCMPTLHPHALASSTAAADHADPCTSRRFSSRRQTSLNSVRQRGGAQEHAPTRSCRTSGIQRSVGRRGAAGSAPPSGCYAHHTAALGRCCHGPVRELVQFGSRCQCCGCWICHAAIARAFSNCYMITWLSERMRTLCCNV